MIADADALAGGSAEAQASPHQFPRLVLVLHDVADASARSADTAVDDVDQPRDEEIGTGHETIGAHATE